LFRRISIRETDDARLIELSKLGLIVSQCIGEIVRVVDREFQFWPRVRVSLMPIARM
jgi:hypothetical protein